MMESVTKYIMDSFQLCQPALLRLCTGYIEQGEDTSDGIGLVLVIDVIDHGLDELFFQRDAFLLQSFK